MQTGEDIRRLHRKGRIMVRIGIDFSMNSPSVTWCRDDGEYNFISFFNDDGKDWRNGRAKSMQYHRALAESGTVEMIPYTRFVKSKDYRLDFAILPRKVLTALSLKDEAKPLSDRVEGHN